MIWLLLSFIHAPLFCRCQCIDEIVLASLCCQGSVLKDNCVILMFQCVWISFIVRVQKYLASQQAGSRRCIEDWIRTGKLCVNGKAVDLGAQVNPNDVITYQRQRWVVAFKHREVEVICYNKPLGRVCAHRDPENRPLVYMDLPECSAGAWLPVGRLDINSTGLLLFTNRGDWAAAMMHPSANWQRCYRVRVFGKLDASMLLRLQQGVRLDGQMCRFSTLRVLGEKQTGNNHWIEVSLSSGKYRMVRRMWSAVGMQVNRLHRFAFGPITLPKSVRHGDCSRLKSADLQVIAKQLKLSL